MSFGTFVREHEAPLLESLSRASTSTTKGETGVAFPTLDGLSWRDAAEHFRAMKDGTSSGEAMVAFGDTLRHLAEHRRGPLPVRARPWSPAFDRAEARTPVAEDPSAMLADFLADELWSLDFAIRGDAFAVARAELATRAAVANAYADALARSGARADRGMAEAIMVVELAGRTEMWARLAAQMRRTST